MKASRELSLGPHRMLSRFEYVAYRVRLCLGALELLVDQGQALTPSEDLLMECGALSRERYLASRLALEDLGESLRKLGIERPVAVAVGAVKVLHGDVVGLDCEDPRPSALRTIRRADHGLAQSAAPGRKAGGSGPRGELDLAGLDLVGHGDLALLLLQLLLLLVLATRR